MKKLLTLGKNAVLFGLIPGAIVGGAMLSGAYGLGLLLESATVTGIITAVSTAGLIFVAQHAVADKRAPERAGGFAAAALASLALYPFAAMDINDRKPKEVKSLQGNFKSVCEEKAVRQPAGNLTIKMENCNF